jgi:glycosyltransferase involved in cell wall biosynthesis
MDGTGTSIVIPAYGHCPHLPGVLRALLDGTIRPDEIIVFHSGPDDPTAAIAAISDAITVLHQSDRLLGGAARNRGAAAARGEWLAFVDADVRPRPDWLDAIRTAAGAAPDRFVIGSVGYATSGGYWGLCNWLSEFSEQVPWHPARPQMGGASCNMIVRRADFEAVGGFAEDYQPGEDTMLFSGLRALGREQWFEPAARVDHFNVAGLRPFLRHQSRLGYHSALVRRTVPLRGSLAARFWPLALVLWLPKLALIGVRLVAGGPIWWLRGLGLAPGLILGSWAWAAGFVNRSSAPECP